MFPFLITLKPTGLVSFKEEYSPIQEFLQQFRDNIQDGSPLYSFITHQGPHDLEGTEIATLNVDDGCYPSRYGDEKMFFQHHSYEEDLKLRPDWYQAYMDGCE